ncbi:ATP-binding protein [Rossellomorea aquimaris]|uniref:histidine kinase n=1 Tax=Rossellomorea aquimaris TaxID=189382 RepID=A0A366ET60_9BACI|nr:ATP-binding protein [Rossellomorea aquimaris]RBP05588.1 signal transduction histidine kinase [Rossellomorea aquimaris]
MKKIKELFQTSLRNQFIGMMSGFIVLFFIGAAFLSLYDQSIRNEYEVKRNQLNQKEDLAEQLDRDFQKAFFDARGYLAFGRQEFKKSIFNQEKKMDDTLKKLKGLETEPEDRLFFKDVEEFSNLYFKDMAPRIISDYEEGDMEAVKEASAAGATATIETFQTQLNGYADSIEQSKRSAYDELKRKESLSQTAFVIFIFLMLLVLMRLMRMIAKQIGHPLNQVASAAEQIAENDSYQKWTFENKRKDEIGKMSRAFEKMIYKIQEKEEHLLAQNEELQAQQDELESQQSELEHLLNMTKNREAQLERRNEFIHGISSSLNKQEVLESIVKSMSQVMGATRGMIVLMDEQKSNASFGISQTGAAQFLTYIYNGIHQRLFDSREPFSLKREMLPPEKGYHEETLYSYDLFLPVLSADQQVEAIMVFSRFGNDFNKQELAEYTSLAKQISISLQKISLFEETEANRQLTQGILNNIQEGIQLIDKDGNSLLMNTKLTALIEGEIDELQQASYQTWKQALIDQVENKEKLDEYYETIVKEGKTGKHLLTYHLVDSKEVFQVYSESLYRGQEQIGTIFVHRNITKEFEVDQMKSEFVSTVSHELRTPLSSVLGFTELMLTKDLKPERTKKYLTTIYQEAKRLTSLINDFLDVQRMESGRQTFERRFEDVVPIMQHVIDTQKVNAPHHSFHIARETDCTIVLGDRDKLSQAFTNLISNAIKYSPDGGTVTIYLREEEDSILIDIRDDGLGIPNEAIPNLFTKFYRVDNSDRRRIGGTGLGLTIVKEIIETHDGEVTVSSEEGKGSVFTIRLPLVTIQTFKEDEHCGNGMNIIVIEDDINLASLLKAELSDSGFKVQHTPSGNEALMEMQESKPDAVVLDIMLEGSMSGWDVLEKMKSDQHLAQVPIIISSALDEKEKGLTLGANDYLVKPYHPSKLSKTILHLMLKNGMNGEILIPVEEKRSK